MPESEIWTASGGIPPSMGSVGNDPVSGVTAIVFFDEGEPYPLAAGSGSAITGAAKPVASVATLADYLVNGFWAYNSALSHHWTSNTITYNINGLNSAEQFLALSALSAWHDV